MNLIYGICFYHGYYKRHNIIEHLSKVDMLKSINPNYEIHFIINCMMDEKDEFAREKLIQSILDDNPQLKNRNDIHFTHNYNSSGTIQGLDDTFAYMTKHGFTDYYVAYFEEDFFPLNETFLSAAMDKLKDDIIYVGENTAGVIKQQIGRTDLGRTIQNKACHLHQSELEVWTDGGFYFTNYSKLHIIKDKLGPFHCGNKDTVYEKSQDGITYGEVGFPTRLYHTGFKFISLPRIQYFLAT